MSNTRYGQTSHDHLVCVYCENDLDIDAWACGWCGEYKGVMTVEFFEDYLKTTFDCDCE